MNMKFLEIVICVISIHHLLFFAVGYNYVGCYADYSVRLLNGTNMFNNAMTINLCVEFCCRNKEDYAGLEFWHQCFCGSDIQLSDDDKVNEQDCNMECGGDFSEICGGEWRLSLYLLPDECRVRSNGKPLENFTKHINEQITTLTKVMSNTTKEPISDTKSCSCQCPIMTSAHMGNKSSLRSLEDIMPEVNRLQNELHIDKKKTNSFSRSKNSQPDARDSSKYIGIVASCIIATPFALAIISDVFRYIL